MTSSFFDGRLSRRAVLARARNLALGLPLLGLASTACVAGDAVRLAPALGANARRRLGVTSVCFREWFAQTHGWLGQVPEAERTPRRITLLEFPAFVAAEFGIGNAEIWNFHFAEQSLDYCRAIRAATDAAGIRIANLQLDLIGVDLAAPDAAARGEALAQTKEWMRRAAACGAPMMRANTNVPVEGRPFDVPLIAQSFRELAEFGRGIGVTILVENHYGSTIIRNAMDVVRAVGDANCRPLLDWGNTPGASTESRIADYAQMFPGLALVSAKGLHFDADYRHVEYDVAALTRAVEQSGFRGVYSIELYVDKDPPRDPVRAVHSMIDAIAPGIVNPAA